MKKIFISIYGILLAMNLNAQGKWSFKAGFNYSSFRNVTNGETKSGFTIGIGHEWQILQNAVITGEIIYVTKSSTLNNKTIGLTPEYTTDLYSHDIHCSIGFIEFPILIKYYMSVNKKIKLALYAGPSLSIGIRDNSEIKNRRFLCTVNSYYYFDNYWNTDSGRYPAISSSGFGMHFGTDVQWFHFMLECRYIYSFHEIDTAADVFILKKLSTLYVLLGIAL